MNLQSPPALSKRGAVSPKQSPQVQHRDWYPYYAGFTEAFVEWVIDRELPHAKSIIDPWNGAGTTTVVCARRGVSSTGVDINPALTVIARARLLPFGKRKELRRLATRIVATAEELDGRPTTEDTLATWIRTDALHRIRAIQRAIHGQLGDKDVEDPRPHVVDMVDGLSDTACFYYCALFSVVRGLLGRYRTTNPMWIKTPRSRHQRVRPSWSTLSEAFTEQVDVLCDRLKVQGSTLGSQSISLMTSNATKLPIPSGQFDGAITSPPYATRMDYVKGMLPELATLGADAAFLSRLRRVVTGTPVVRGVSTKNRGALKSASATAVLATVLAHSSRGSRSYYLPWLRNYFQDLQYGIEELVRAVVKTGTVCIIVQDSYYKDHRIDLQTIVAELMQECGRPLKRRVDYATPVSRPNLRWRGSRASARRATETLLVF